MQQFMPMVERAGRRIRAFISHSRAVAAVSAGGPISTEAAPAHGPPLNTKRYCTVTYSLLYRRRHGYVRRNGPVGLDPTVAM